MNIFANSPNIVFIVDDDDELRESLIAVLETRGYTVCGFDNPKLALAAISGAMGVPMIMMVDGALPGMEGREVIARVATTHPQIPIVAISGEPHRREGMLKAGAQVFFDKPIDVSELLKTIEDLVKA